MFAATAAVLGAAVLFGTSGTSQALLAPDASPLSVAAVRLLIGATGLIAFVVWLGRRTELAALWRRPIVWVMGIGVAGYQGLFFLALQATGVAIGTLIALGSAPLLAGVLGWIVREGAPGWPWLGATVIAVTGLGMLTLGGGGQPDLWGVLAAIGAGGSYGIYTVFGARLARDGHDSSVVMAAPFAIGAVLLAPFLLAASWVFTPSGLTLAIWLGLAVTTLAYLLFGLALPVLQPGHIATLTLAEPVVATFLGVLVLGETLTATGWIGCLLVLVALAMLGIVNSRGAIDPRASTVTGVRG